MATGILSVIFGLLFGGIGAACFLMTGLGVFSQVIRGYPILSGDLGDLPFLGGFGAMAILFSWYGVSRTWRGIRLLRTWRVERKELPPEAELALRPWLRNPLWRHREILFNNPVSDSALALAYFFFGLPALGFLWAGITDPPTYTGERMDQAFRLELLLVGAVLAFVVGGLTYWRLRRTRYGNSVCRLLTLPGVVGGWLKADVECALPAGVDDLVTVRLKNVVPRGRRFTELWRMEQSIAVPVAPATRTVVPVRLRIQRVAAQQPMTVAGDGASWLLTRVPIWILEVEKKVPGIDFLAAFQVPVYDTPNAPTSEQGEA